MTRRLAKLSDEAYKDKIELKGYDSKFIEDKDTDTQCHILHDEGEVYIVFRGTESFTDWANNLKVKFNEEGIHSGFNRAYNSIRFKIMNHLNDIDYRFKSIFVCGHSRGGALAVICAHRLKHVTRVATFGSPMVGDKDFHKAYQRHDRTFRWENYLDFVTRLPSDKAGYKPVGQIKWLTRSGVVKHYKPWWADYFAFSKSNHKMKNYIKKIERMR